VTGPHAEAWGAHDFYNPSRVTWEQVDGHAQIRGPAEPVQVLDQLVADRGEHRGVDSFEFEVAYENGDGESDRLSVEVWGIDGAPSISPWRSPEPIRDMEPFTADLLYDSGNLLDDGDFDWKTVAKEIDFGKGYEYLYTRFQGNGVSYKDGDVVMIDNVSLGGGSEYVIQEEWNLYLF
jgi:hypothetical protein